MKADELFETAISAVNAIATDEDRFEHRDIHSKLINYLAEAREIWVTQNGGRIPQQWLATEELELICSEQFDEYEGDCSCYAKFKMPNFINIKGANTFSITYPNGRPYNYVASSYSEFQGWNDHPFFKNEDVCFIHDGILNIRTKAKIRPGEVILITGIPYDIEELSTFNPMHDDLNVTPDIVNIAIGKLLKPLMYVSRIPLDTVDNSKDNQVQQQTK